MRRTILTVLMVALSSVCGWPQPGPPPVVNQITRSGNWGGMVALSPDGKTLAYTLRPDGGGSIFYLRDVASGTEKTVPVPGGPFSGLLFGPDSKTLYFLRRDPARESIALLYEWQVDKPPKKLNVDDVDTVLSFSPDGKSFAFVRYVGQAGARLIVADLATGKEREVYAWKNPHARPTGPAWSPDGSEIAVSENRRKLSFITTRKGTIRDIATPGQISSPIWPLKGNGLYMSMEGHDRLRQIWRYLPATNQWAQITRELAGLDFGRISASADGSLIVAARLHTVKTGAEDLLTWFGAKDPSPRINPDVILIRLAK